VASLRLKGAAPAQELDELTAEVKMLQAQVESARARRDLLNAPARQENVRLAEARVKEARARLDVMRHECSRTILRAPVSAQVLRINVQAGELTGPDSQEPAMILADVSQLFVRAYIDEFDAARVRLGMWASVMADGDPRGRIKGRVVRLAPRMTQKPLRTDDPLERFDTKAREIWIELNKFHSQNLVIGLPVDVVLVDRAGVGTDGSSDAENSERDVSNVNNAVPRQAARLEGEQADAVPGTVKPIPLQRERHDDF
jgi:HlyD family secretion protein